MRLLYFDAGGELSLTKDLIEGVPPYAILSHTWGAEEVTFQDLQNGNYKSMAGYTKIRFCGRQAQKDGIDHFWVDTCCIDKLNQPELTEAIVSMFRWYKNALRCYVFMADVGVRKRDIEGNQVSWDQAFRRSRWFTRGWTLQELLAPTSVEFFSKEGERLGDKTTLEQTIHEITTIPTGALCGSSLTQFSVPERLQWTDNRVTTRAEDRAYCLLGIFNVFISPIYGEGDNAFDRLKDEISKSYRRQLDGVRHAAIVSKSPDVGKHSPTSASVQIPQALLHEHRATLLASLSFDQMDSRRSTIKVAYSTTCQWLLKHPAYLEWIDPSQFHQHHGFLWIDGKPGAGKSTLVKFAYARAEKERPEDEILISFFFNARGDELEKSTSGLYRALLYQLLNKAPDLQTLLDELPDTPHNENGSLVWTTESLCELLSAAVSRLGQRRLKCFVDALDECDEQQVQDMVYFFEDLGQNALDAGVRLSTCFASRPYPTIDVQRCLKLTLEKENGHVEDLTKYIRNHLRAGKGPYIEEVRKQVQEKANGVFMWMVLVVDVLNKEFLRGRIFAVKQKLREIPAKLSDLFKDILRRDGTNMDDLLLCLQWILFAKRPLFREEFYLAMAAGLDSDSEYTTEWDTEHVTTDDVNRFVLNSSKGLAELTRSKPPTVQFIHESVRDFLIKDNGLYELWPELKDSVYSSSHDQLKRCCQSYLKINTISYFSSDDLPSLSSNDLKDLRRTLTTKSPFLKYAHEHLLYHADEAAASISQDDFLKQWPIKTWISIGNVLVQHNVQRHTLSASSLYLLAEHGFARLIRTLRGRDPIMGVRGERYHYALFAALANDHQEAVWALLSRCGDPSRVVIDGRLEFGKAFSVPKNDTPFLWALKRGHGSLAELLFTSADIDVNHRDTEGRTVLSYAAENENEAMVQLLLDRGANIKAVDVNGWTALDYAASSGYEATVQLLLDRGANIEAVDEYSWTALHRAASSGYEATV